MSLNKYVTKYTRKNRIFVQNNTIQDKNNIVRMGPNMHK